MKNLCVLGHLFKILNLLLLVPYLRSEEAKKTPPESIVGATKKNSCGQFFSFLQFSFPSLQSYGLACSFPRAAHLSGKNIKKFYYSCKTRHWFLKINEDQFKLLQWNHFVSLYACNPWLTSFKLLKELPAVLVGRRRDEILIVSIYLTEHRVW